MIGPDTGYPGRALLVCALVVLAGLAMVACNGGDNEASDVAPAANAGPTAEGLALPFLATPPERRRLPEGVSAIAWDGIGSQQLISEEPLPEGYEAELVVKGLQLPTGLAFLPDGRILVGEQHAGRIRVIKDGELRGRPFATIGHVVQGHLELGLLGIAVDPEFEKNHWVYAFYVEADAAGEPGRSVLLRFKEQKGVAASQIELAEFPAAATDKHNGGGLEFGPDGKLYLPIGDTDRRDQAADPAQPVGKIFRLNRDGTAPQDNPLVDREGADPRVYAYGFRNLLDVAFHPDLPGRLIAPDNAVWEFDEINIVRPGGFYGWPQAAGFTDDDGVENPVWVYLNAVAPAGIEVYTGDTLPEFKGDIFLCAYNEGGVLHRIRFSSDFRRVEFDTAIAPGCSASVAEGPDGFLYFVRRDQGELQRIVAP